MNSPARDLADILETAGVAAKGATVGWGLFRGQEPSKPDTSITLYDSGGGRPAVNMLIDEPTVQARIRAGEWAYAAAYDKAIEVRDALHAFARQTVSGTLYMAVFARNDPQFLMYDESNRPIFTINFEITRQPESGVHRG